MLYLSTRNRADSFTAYRVLHSEEAPEHGQFMPMQIPVLTDYQLAQFEQLNFGEAVATVMNLFFGTKISGWDVDFAVGRQAASLANIGHKAYISESWHNPFGSHQEFSRMLYLLVCDKKQPVSKQNLWFEAAVNIAVLFGTYGKLSRQEIYEFDVAVQSGDLQQLFAIRYAQKMGLPVRNIILGAMDGDGLWEFLSHGDYHCAGKTFCTGMEALLWLEFGPAVAEAYVAACADKAIFRLNETELAQFRKGVYTAVVGDQRAEAVAGSILHTSQYAMEHTVARAFGALQDYRARTGSKRNTLLLSQRDPTASRHKNF